MFYSEKAIPKNKEEIAKFLTNHPRYVNGFGKTTSYSHCVKVNRLGLSASELEKAASIMEVDDYWSDIRYTLRQFQNEMNGEYQIVSGGRQNGYLILMESEVYDPGYKSTCHKCGQLNYQPVSPQSCKCGVCGGPRSNLKNPLLWSRVLGSGIDHGLTYTEMMDWSHSQLKSRLDLVRSFDAACDNARNAFKRVLNEYMLVEKTIMVPQKVMSLERITI